MLFFYRALNFYSCIEFCIRNTRSRRWFVKLDRNIVSRLFDPLYVYGPRIFDPVYSMTEPNLCEREESNDCDESAQVLLLLENGSYLSKRFRTFSSLWPMNLASSSGPLTEIIRKFHMRDSCDTKYVLPVPGDPYNRIPAWLRSGDCSNICGYFDGQMRTSSNTVTTDSRPANGFLSHSFASSSSQSSNLILFSMPCRQYAFVVFSELINSAFVIVGFSWSELVNYIEKSHFDSFIVHLI